MACGWQVWAEDTLHEQVDSLIQAKAAGHAVSPAADDAEFLRRAWLDFDGGIPSAEEARAFLQDASPTKRTALIETLIAAPRFAERMADAFNVMLMERRGENPAWRKWLKPALEILAGVPTVVYGYFAALTVAPLVRDVAQSLGVTNASSEN